MDRMVRVSESALAVETGTEGIRPYERPSIRVMDEKEVLSAFQVTVAAISWWVM